MNTAERHAIFQEASRVLTITPQGFFGKNVKRFKGSFGGPRKVTHLITTGKFGLEARTTTLLRCSKKSGRICLTDLEYDWQFTAQIESGIQRCEQIAQFMIEQEVMRVYSENCGRKISYNEALVDIAAGVEPTSPISWAVLNYLYEEQNLLATPANARYVDTDGRLVFSVVGGYQGFDFLKHQDSGPGFVFDIIQFPTNWDNIDRTWVRRYPYAEREVVTTTDVELEIDPSYQYASCGDIIIFLNGVIDVSESIDKWTMTWVPEKDEKGELTDFGHWGFSCEYIPRVLRPDLGAVIRVKRVAQSYGEFTCEPTTEPLTLKDLEFNWFGEPVVEESDRFPFHPWIQRVAKFLGFGTKRRLVYGIELQLRETLLKLQQQHKS